MGVGMLAKNPSERLSVVDIFAHPWTQTNYSKKHSHPSASSRSSKSLLSSVELHKANPDSTKSVLAFKETSMIHYLDQLFGDEIQKELEENGSYEVDGRDKLGSTKVSYDRVFGQIMLRLITCQCQ